MEVAFIEVKRGFWKNSYEVLGKKEVPTIPMKGDVIQKNGKRWTVLCRGFVFDSEIGDYIKVYIEPYGT